MSTAIRQSRGALSKDLLCFELDGIKYALPVACVREVTHRAVCARVPLVPESVVGLADFRGKVMVVLDLRKRYGLPVGGDDLQQRWIVVEHGGRLVGLEVDAVVDVFSSHAHKAYSVPEIGTAEMRASVSAVLNHKGDLAFVLDVARVVAPAVDVDVSAVSEPARSES